MNCLSLAAAVIALILQLHATGKFGAGLSPDSATYVQGARRLAAGEGFTQANPLHDNALAPITWYPPAYPVLLSFAPRFHADLLHFARLTSAICFALVIAMTTQLIATLTRSVVFTTIAILILIFSQDQLEIFSYALSEPLFIVAVLASLISIGLFLQNNQRRWLVAAAIAASLAAMTRYLGLMLVPLGVGLIALQTSKSVKHRAIEIAIFTPIALAANLVWAIRNHFAGSSTGRKPAWHPAGVSHLFDTAQTFARWLLPTHWSALWPIAAALALCVLVAWLIAYRRSPKNFLARVLIAFVLTYFVALLAAISTIDAAAPMDYRLLAPIFIPGVALVAWSGVVLWNDRSATLAWAGRIIVVLVGSLLIVNEVSRTPGWIHRGRKTGEGLGYASKRWTDSRAMRALHRISQDWPTYTNATDATYLRVSRVDRVLPSKFDRAGVLSNPNYPDAIEAVRQIIWNEHGAVVYFVGVLRRGMPTPDDLQRDLPGLKRIEFHNDAIIFAQPATAKKIAGELLTPVTKRAKKLPKKK